MSDGKQRVFVNACSLVNSLGVDAGQINKRLTDGDVSGMTPWEHKIQDREVYVGKVTAALPQVPDTFAHYACRNNQLILAALQNIHQEVDALLSKYPRERIAVILGSSTSGILEGELALAALKQNGQMPAAYHYRQQEIGTPALFLRDYLGLQGPAYTISTACSSSAKVFATARRLLHAEICDAAIVGGADSLCKLTVFGFAALDSMAKARCNPMSANRDGINIGEAAGLFILTKEEGSVELVAAGESSDAHHMSAPHPQGAGAIRSMRAALAEAGLEAADISYINLHGTATPLNDAMESLAVNAVFGSGVPCSSTKPLTGHTLGAAGATEVGFCWLLLTSNNRDVVLPPHIWDGQADPALPALNLVCPRESVPLRSGTAVLSNSFAFGGNNASVILRKS